MKPTITIEATDELKELTETITKKIDDFVKAVKMCDVMHDDLYLCDPEKNTQCRKTACYINGGECHLTSQKAYRLSKRREEEDE